MEKSIVTVSRHWNNPEILTNITDESISLSIHLSDFISALKEEIGSVTTTITQKSFSDKMDKAVVGVIERIKEESAKVI
jgi:hypothetical protein